MRANLKSVDCIIEIHDARISFLLYYTIKQYRLLNKKQTVVYLIVSKFQ